MTPYVMAALLLLAPPEVGSADGRIVKMARILSLEDHRTVGGGELERYLRDTDRGVRRRAALAAGRVGIPSRCRPSAS